LGKPLNLIRLGEDRWRWEDRALAVALTMYEDGLCGRCGHPRDRAYNPDMDGHYSLVEHTCHACAVRDRDVAELAGGEVEPGRMVAVVDDAWVSGFEPDPEMLRKILTRD
jgi:hypothetical protein